MKIKSCLSLLLPLVFLGCNSQETNVTNSVKSDGAIAIAPRFVSTAAVPQVARLKVTVSVPGRSDSVIDVPHSPGGSMVLGTIPVGSGYDVTALGYDTAGEKIARFWGKGSGTATSAAEAVVVIPLSVGPEAPVAQADSLVVGGKLTLSSGMWYTLDGNDPRAVASNAKAANGPITMDKAGTVKAASKTAADSTKGSPVIWSSVSSWIFAAAGAVVSKDTSLSGLSVSPIVGSLSPAFVSTQTAYTATVDSGVTSVTVTGTPKLSSASVTYGNGATSGVVSLGNRTEDTTVAVTVSNGGKSLVYTVTFKRKVYAVVAVARDSTLSSLSTSPGVFKPAFASDNSGPYVDSVPAGTSSVTVSAVATTADDVDSITYNGETDSVVTLNTTGNTTISVVVTNLNGNSNIYTITVVKKAAPSVVTAKDSTLSALSLNGSPVKGFIAGVSGASSRSYVDSVVAGATTATLSATATTSGSTIADTGSVSLSLTDPNIKTVTVTNGNGNKLVYTITIYHKAVLAKTKFTLTSSGTSGSISLNPSGGTYDSGTLVTATVTANSGYSFSGWSEACTGTGACEVTMTGNKSLNASFTVMGTTTTASDFGIPWNASITYDSLKDSRDGQVYRTMMIGGKTWMAQNLNFAGGGLTGVCYNKSADSCAKYGRLYTWAEVMNNANSSSLNPSKVQGNCPTGWHVPSYAEWAAMQKVVDAGSTIDGTKLKSTSGWSSNPGTDDSGFRALPGGYDDGSNVYYAGSQGYWWSATQYSDNTASAWLSYMNSNTKVLSGTQNKAIKHSLRCSKD